jgi:hypothetical protein
MKKLFVFAVSVFCAIAQTPTEPTLLIQLTRTAGINAQMIRPYANAGVAINALGMKAITGVNETWFLEGHDSFASIEELDKALNAVLPARNPQEEGFGQTRTLIGILRPSWSYRPDLAIKLFPRAHYFHISLHRIRPGSEAEFAEIVKNRRSGFDRLNLDRPDIAYQVISGAQADMYIFVAPLTSLKTLDDALARMPAVLEGTRSASKNPLDVEISREHLLLRVEPQISWVSEGFVAADPEFWKPKSR